MASYNFKKEVKVYLVLGTQRWKIEVNPDISFSQTFAEQASNVKTLHSPLNYFQRATITKANPGNWSLSAPLNNAGNTTKLLDWILTDTTGNSLQDPDVYVDTGTDIFRLEKCPVDSATFQFVKNQIPTVSVSGTMRKLSRTGYTSAAQIPGVLQASDTVANTSIILPKFMNVELDAVQLKNITSVSVEVKNDVQWIENNNIHASLLVTGASDTVYPEAFVVSGKVLSGTIQQYLSDENRGRLQTWSTTSTLRIRLGNTAAFNFDVNLPSIVFTNRLDTQEVFVQSYDFRMNVAPPSLRNIFILT